MLNLERDNLHRIIKPLVCGDWEDRIAQSMTGSVRKVSLGLKGKGRTDEMVLATWSKIFLTTLTFYMSSDMTGSWIELSM